MNYDSDEFRHPIGEQLAEIQERFDRYQRDKFPSRTSEFFCLELCGEAGELANLEKKSWKGRDIPHERVADEAADVLIALMNFANAKGIRLGEAVVTKLEWIENKRRTLEERGEKY